MVNVKNVDLGYGVSYGVIYIIKNKIKIVIIFIGYVDGYLRVFLLKVKVLIYGSYVLIIGRVCMD